MFRLVLFKKHLTFSFTQVKKLKISVKLRNKVRKSHGLMRLTANSRKAEKPRIYALKATLIVLIRNAYVEQHRLSVKLLGSFMKDEKNGRTPKPKVGFQTLFKRRRTHLRQYEGIKQLTASKACKLLNFRLNTKIKA